MRAQPRLHVRDMVHTQWRLCAYARRVLVYAYGPHTVVGLCWQRGQRPAGTVKQAPGGAPDSFVVKFR